MDKGGLILLLVGCTIIFIISAAIFYDVNNRLDDLEYKQSRIVNTFTRMDKELQSLISETCDDSIKIIIEGIYDIPHPIPYIHRNNISAFWNGSMWIYSLIE